VSIALTGKISALSDYYAMDHDIAFSMDTPETHRLLMLVDPYSYRDRLSMPKYIITASGDDFFPPDSTHLYLDDMKGSTWLRTLPNSRHYGWTSFHTGRQLSWPRTTPVHRG
jgi:PhoPQ-activated pathogenicity-related protein